MRDPDYDYFFSKALEIEFAVHKEKKHVWTADKVKYSTKELDLLRGSGITKNIHEVKRIFKGEIYGATCKNPD